MTPIDVNEVDSLVAGVDQVLKEGARRMAGPDAPPTEHDHDEEECSGCEGVFNRGIDAVKDEPGEYDLMHVVDCCDLAQAVRERIDAAGRDLDDLDCCTIAGMLGDPLRRA